MKNLLLMACVACAATVFASSSAFAGSGKGSGKGPTTGIEIQNVNDFDDENGDIRIWILTEEQVQSPPTTKGEAAGLESTVQSPFAFYTYEREAGTYFIVASNESHFASLGDDDPFTPGEDFSLLQVDVAEEMIKSVSTFNTETPTLLPELVCEDDGDDDDGGDE